MRKTVGMIIEGSYPYIVGGVASWCQQIISKTEDFDFKVIAILPEEYKKKKKHYNFPPNIVEYQEIWLDEAGIPEANSAVTNRKERQQVFWEQLPVFIEMAKYGNYGYLSELLKFFSPPKESAFTFKDFFASREFLQTVKDLYNKYYPDVPFLQFFWTMQTMLRPIYNVMTYDIIKADVYHTISTGYAGFIGILAKIRYKAPLLLTEHGIYMNERRDELEKSKSIKGDFKAIWRTFFKVLCSSCYAYCDRVITLYNENAYTEIEEECDPDRIEIIPNGVNIDMFTSLGREEHDKVTVGIVARVVPIKDVKTFIRAAAICVKENHQLEFLIIGPTDEDEKYFEECVKLVDELDVKDFIIFTGTVQMTEYYPKIDMMILTSEREAQPLTLIEAMAARIPCVASDVGSCRDILEGVGFITPRKSPEDTAKAILALAANKRLRDRLGDKGQEKAVMVYKRSEVINEYRRIYSKYT